MRFLQRGARIGSKSSRARTLDNNNDSSLVQVYEETPPIRPLRSGKSRQQAAPRQSVPRPNKRPTNRERAAAPQTAPVKKERKLFNVLLNTQTGFQETAGYAQG